MKRGRFNIGGQPGPQDMERVVSFRQLSSTLGMLIRPAIELVIPKPPADHLELSRKYGELIDELSTKAPVIPLPTHRETDGQ